MNYKEFKEKYEAWNEARKLAYLDNRFFDNDLNLKNEVMVITITDTCDGPKVYINGCMNFYFRDIDGDIDPEIVKFYTGNSFNDYVKVDIGAGFRWVE